jgi:hypothetical protein
MRDGYVVIENEKIDFANEIIRLIFCKLLGLKDLYENINDLGIV